MKRELPAILLLLCGAAYSQDADPSVIFEVASVKPAPPPEPNMGIRFGCNGGPGTPNPGTYNCMNATLSDQLMRAYDLKRYQLPASLLEDTARYNIAAKLPAGATRTQFKSMLRNLLAERFKLAFHYEKKEMASYELTVLKGGAKLQESPPEPPPLAEGATPEPPPPMPNRNSVPKDEFGFPIFPPRRHMSSSTMMANGLYHWESTDAPMDQLVDMLSGQLGKPVVDSTGLTAKYDIRISFLSPSAPVRQTTAPGVTASEPSNAISVFAAVQKILGLKLEPSKNMIDVVVVDHVEKTVSEN